MDDHRLSLKDYQDALTGRWAGTALVAALAIAVIGIGWFTTQSWNDRFNRVFEPLPGLLYTPPEVDLGLTTADNPIPLSFQSINQDDAYKYNASIPVDPSGLEAAAPFMLPANLAEADRNRAIDCLAQAVYYEAASESPQGQRAVAQVVLNRMRHPAFPASVCGVVYSGSQRTTGCQFTFTCDGALARAPSVGGWTRARAVALAALSGYVETSVGQATHYHTLWVAPYWSPSLLKIANIGAHTFYRWKGMNGRRSSFTSAYRGSEPILYGRTTPAETPSVETPAELLTAPPTQMAAVTHAPAELPSIALPQPVAAAPESAAPVAAPVVVAAAPPVQAAPAAAQVNAAPAEQRTRRRVARAGVVISVIAMPPVEIPTTVGIVIPFYQRDLGVLRHSLDSIAAQILPPFVRLKIVIVDDTSPLPATEALEGFRIAEPHSLEIVRQPNGGPGAARNGGLDHLSDLGVDYVAFLDSDDTWSADHIRLALEALSRGADFYFANSGFNAGDSFGHWRYFRERHGGPPEYSPLYGELDPTSAMDAIAEECLPHTSQVVYDLRRHSRLRFDVTFRRACEDQLFFLALSRNASRIAYSTRLMGQRGKGVSIYDATLAWNSPEAPNRVIEELRYRKILLRYPDFGVGKKLRIFASAREKVDHLVFLTFRNARYDPALARATVKRFLSEAAVFGVFVPTSILTLPFHYLKLRADARALQEAQATK